VLWFIGLWAIFVYAPVAHCVNRTASLAAGNSDGWIKVPTSLAAQSCTSPRRRRPDGVHRSASAGYRPRSQHGADLRRRPPLWVGWFGFKAGSAVTAGMQAGMAMLVTHMATATAAFVWMIVEWMMRGKPTVIGICTGAVAGLVAITPASGFVGPSARSPSARRRHRLLRLHRPQAHAGL
jgi:Amt family ammonium transporter